MKLHFHFAAPTDPEFGIKVTFKTAHEPKHKMPAIGTPRAEFQKIPTNPATMQAIQAIIEQTIINQSARAFLRPVDQKIDQAPGYYDLITKAIDLGMMYKKANNKGYMTFDEFTDDMSILIDNALKYNPEQHPIHQDAIALSYFFKDLLNKVEQNPAEVANNRQPHLAEKEIGNEFQRFQKRKSDFERSEKENSKRMKEKTKEKKVTAQEIDDLATNIKKLDTCGLIGVIEIVQQKPFTQSMLPFYADIAELDSNIVETLRNYVSSCLENSNKGAVYYAWRPTLPKKLYEIRETYEAELASWQAPPPDTQLN